MNRTGRRRLVALVLGALTHLVVWLVIRPDTAGAQWDEGRALEVWLVLEALLAGAVGVLAPGRQTVVVTVVAGWFLQTVHFALFGEHYDDTLWGVGLVVTVVLGAVSVGLALLARRLTGRDRRRVSP